MPLESGVPVMPILAVMSPLEGYFRKHFFEELEGEPHDVRRAPLDDLQPESPILVAKGAGLSLPEPTVEIFLDLGLFERRHL